MLLFISTNDNLKSKKMEVEEKTTIGKLMQQSRLEFKTGSDYDEDNEVYLANQDQDFDKGKTIQQCGIKHGDHVFIGKCKRVNIAVAYHGRNLTLETSPALMLKRLKKLVSENFGMSDQEVAEFQFLLNGNALDSLDIMVGSLVNYCGCSISLVFAPKKDINGFFETPLEILHNDLDDPNYLSGEIEGKWGKVGIENEPEGFIFLFWLIAKNGMKYYLRFDLTNYNKEAPTAQLWDMDLHLPLSQQLFPDWSPRCTQVFRIWGIQSLYLPCDRLAFSGHPNWEIEHPSLVWENGEDSIYKYLNEVYQILN